MSEVTLKLCPVPWCERVNKPEFYNPEPKAYCVACPDCGLETNVFATEAEAIAAWNTRAEASSAEPVAWMYRQMTTAEADHVEFTRTPWINVPPSWTETPLYAHPPAVPDTVNRALVEHMRETIREWERDEPRDDWWLHQHDHAAAADLIETQAREIKRLRKLTCATWFYMPDEGDRCWFSPHEVIDEMYDPEPGNHVFEVECATSLPSIWCAVRVTDDPDADERFTFTEHETEAEARAALAGDSHDQ